MKLTITNNWSGPDMSMGNYVQVEIEGQKDLSFGDDWDNGHNEGTDFLKFVAALEKEHGFKFEKEDLR